MQNKGMTLSIVLTLIVGCLVFIAEFTNKNYAEPNTVYQVYLDGQELGLIQKESELYELINEDQSDIIDMYGEYGVDYVYPPNNFDIVKRVTYNDNITNVNTIYNHIKEETNFTIKGYIVTVKSNEDEKEDFEIYIINKEVFTEAIVELISAFVDRDQFEAYIDGNQLEIVETGKKIEEMDLDENITIKDAYISVEQKIFTDATELSRYLLFGSTETTESHIVKEGDTVSSIANDNQLNEQEFLIANPEIPTVTTPLIIGDRVSVDLISPTLTLKYQMLIVEDVEVTFESEVKYDNTKPSSYKDVTQKGANGIQRATKTVQVINGEENQGVDKIDFVTIKSPINEVITRGRRVSIGGGNHGEGHGSHVDTGQTWAWPTNSPYIISSGFKWRWGKFHDGIDITGTGYGSNIYAVSAGEVISAGWGGMVGNSAGYNVVINHENGYYTVYAHLSRVNVRVGQRVARKDVIGGMGASGVVTGTHLHFSVATGGAPYNGGIFIDPMRLWR